MAMFLAISIPTFAWADDPLPPLPPLTDPATGIARPGKIVWADLFVDDVELAREFYTQLFGWTWRWITPDRRTYGILEHDGLLIAGIAHLDPDKAEDPYGRWVHYLSTENVQGVAEATVAAGGRILLEPRVHAERGEFAIAADSEGAIFGLLNSQSGDPGDYRAEEGEWLWHVLYSRQVNSSALFYQERFDYEMFEYAWNDETRRLVLASQDYARASVSPIPEDDQDNRPAWIGFIKTADVPGAVARAEALGAEVLFAPSPDVHNNGIAIIADPLGGIIGLLSWVTTDGEDQP